jgi:hypothetical protein
MRESLSEAFEQADGTVMLSICLHQGGPRWIDAVSDGRIRGRTSSSADAWRSVEPAELAALLPALAELKPGPIGQPYTVQLFSDEGDWEVHTDDARPLAGELEGLLQPVAAGTLGRVRRAVRPLLLPIWMLPAGLLLVGGLSGEPVLMAVFGGLGLLFAALAAAASWLVFQLR